MSAGASGWLGQPSRSLRPGSLDQTRPNPPTGSVGQAAWLAAGWTFAPRAQISPLTVTAEARTIVGSYLGSAVPSRDIPKYAQLWREGKLPVEELISSRIALADINQAMDQLADGKAVRQVIMFDAG